MKAEMIALTAFLKQKTTFSLHTDPRNDHAQRRIDVRQSKELSSTNTVCSAVYRSP
jgi:hypothetical protein